MLLWLGFENKRRANALDAGSQATGGVMNEPLTFEPTFEIPETSNSPKTINCISFREMLAKSSGAKPGTTLRGWYKGEYFEVLIPRVPKARGVSKFFK